jgi:hypothetical protein
MGLIGGPVNAARAAATGTATRKAATSHAADLERQAPARDGVDRDAADAALAIRTLVSARQRTRRPARTARRRLDRVATRRTKRRRTEQRRCQQLSAEHVRSRMVQIAELDRAAALMGHLTAWLPGIVVVMLAIPMVVADPGTVYNALRHAFDVPASVGLLDMSNPNVLVALAAAMAVSVGLLATARFTGRALGTLLFRGRIATDEHPEAVRSVRLLGPVQVAVYAAIGLALLAGFMLVLHAFAEARFQAGVAATVSGTAAANAWVVVLVTALPVVILAFETLASAPQFEHARTVSRWARRARLAERFDVWRNQRQLAGEARAGRSARRAVLAMTDVIGDVSIRGLAEAIEAALGGLVSVREVAETYRTEPAVPPAAAEGPATAPLDLSGSPAGQYLRGLPVVSNEVVEVLARFQQLEEPPALAPLARIWHDLRADPGAYCAVEAHEETDRSCVRERPEPASATGIHSVPASDSDDKPTAEQPAA